MEIKFTGASNTGKTHLMNRIMELLREEGVKVDVGSYNGDTQVHTLIIKGQDKYRLPKSNVHTRCITLMRGPVVGGNLVVSEKGTAFIIGVNQEVADRLSLSNGSNVEITIKKVD